jgi:hypothetical protein
VGTIGWFSFPMAVRLGFSILVAAGILVGLTAGAVAQTAPVELIKADITRMKSLDSGQWTVLGVRLGDSKETALKTLQQVKDIQVKEEPAVGRIFVSIPPPNGSVVMSVKITENQVTAINMIGGFGEWLQGDTRLLFRAFEDDSLRYKLLGREDQREVVKGGTNEAPAVDMSFAYFKEGMLLHYGIKRSADGKQIESLREMVLVFPAKPR